jgi:aspartyl-tRNA(Asn)/glutamyl-tRNA(Gln) amidotransferase subunit A
VPGSADPALTDLGAAEAARRIRDGALSPVALVEACLARIRAVDARLEAWVYLDEAGALAAARDAEDQARTAAGRRVLHGVPVGIKDIFHVAGMPTRAGAAAFAHSRPGRDAVSVARLRAAGAIVLGKTHTTQFAYRDPAPTRNPWNTGHTPGGSSAGSAVAVAARMVPLALGSQTVGSVLRPAAYCGVVGFKGTHGLVPADGVIPLAWSFDHVGGFTRCVADAALTLGVLLGQAIDPVPPARPRIALVPELLARADGDVAGQLSRAADRFAAAGATVVEVKLPASYARLAAAGQIVLEAEAAAYHETDFRAHAAEYGQGIRAAIEAGLAHSATAYIAANRARLQFREEVLPLLADHDALLTPTAPTVAPAGLSSTGDASLCAPWSWAGVPSISLPAGLGVAGLPHAVQLVAAAHGERGLLGTAAWCEGALAFASAPRL